MNRKHNPWVSLTALLLLAVVLVLICTGCGVATTAEAADNSPRFTIVCHIDDAQGPDVYIITDTETGVQYMYVQNYGYGSGLTLLQPADTVEE